MGNVLEKFFRYLVEQFLNGNYFNESIDAIFEKLAHNTFFIEDSIGMEYGNYFNLDNVMAYVMSFAMILIILKFLKKGFDIYIAWTDDPAADPIVLVTNLLKALVIALSFPLLYELLTNIVEDLTNGLLNALSLQSVEIDFQDALLTTPGIMWSIFSVGFCVLLVILYFKFLIRSAELFVLRVGFPLACVGIIDANGGVFTGYVNKLFQTVLSVTVQLVLAKLGLVLPLGEHPIWAIVFMVLAIKSPNILRDLIYTPAGGGMGLSRAYYATQMIRGFAKK